MNYDLAGRYLKLNDRGLESESADDGEWRDPSGLRYWFGYYDLHLEEPLTVASDDYNYFMYVFYGSKCDGDKIRLSSASNSFSLSIVLEGGGVYCLDG